MQKSLILFLIMVSAVPCIKAQQSNQTILIEFIAELINEHIEPGENFFLELHPTNQFALLELQSKLNDKRAYEITTSKDAAKQILTITVDAENTLTTKSSNQNQRKLLAQISVQLVQIDNSILHLSVMKGYAYEDTIRDHNPDLLASGWYPARFHEMIDESRMSRWKRYFEPVIVTTAVATTVYLIYNVRSQ